ncbi:LCI family antimicrobial peptide [Xenorhabdus sp. XENO-10]|uniref:LCI family antimicrobial peptide n=1 Tax=Xenorhabdus yunnanensis TaxID=3025878 RepID=A0ABT5LKP1_9GAMM|nr:LCI fold-containing protein [Xenorhabdus yunnanensis]MDC9590414.1 LCI family antimicrobial peptide [Xenorhabdus yunnanensis]
MFRKLLTVGALAAALIGGIGTASAFSGYEYCINSQGYDSGKGVEVRSVVHAENRFANVFTEGGFKWYFKTSKSCNNGQYVALYEGRRI